MENHNKARTLMVLGFGIGCIITILVSLNPRYSSNAGSPDDAPVAETESRAVMCGRLHPDVPNRVWDSELEVYLPPNYGWWECMGVGVK